MQTIACKKFLYNGKRQLSQRARGGGDMYAREILCKQLTENNNYFTPGIMSFPLRKLSVQTHASHRQDFSVPQPRCHLKCYLLSVHSHCLFRAKKQQASCSINVDCT